MRPEARAQLSGRLGPEDVGAVLVGRSAEREALGGLLARAAKGLQRRFGAARRGRGRQDRAAGRNGRCRGHEGMQTARLTGGGAGDAAGLRRAAPVPAPVRRSPGAAARPAAGRAAEHVRAGRRAACGPVPGRAGGADAASRSPNPRCSTCPASPPSSSTTAIPRAHPPRPLPSFGPILLDHCHPSGRWIPPRPLCSEEDDRLLAFVYI